MENTKLLIIGDGDHLEGISLNILHNVNFIKSLKNSGVKNVYVEHLYKNHISLAPMINWTPNKERP